MGGDGEPASRWSGSDPERDGHEPWLVAYADRRPAWIDRRRAELDRRPGYELHPRCVVATDAHVVAERLHIGSHSTIASGCVIRGEVEIGGHSSLNAGASTIGRVIIGNIVRIARGVVLVGENHVIDDLEVPIALQGLTSEGVVIGDDVWIGANATVLDGVTVGDHAVVAAGAVVTRDVAEWTVVAGVPARPIRDRKDPTRSIRRDGLTRFADGALAQWADVLERCRVEHDGVGSYVDRPGAPWGPRPLNEAVELAGSFGEVPPVAPRDDLVERIRALQDPATGLFPDPREGSPAVPLKPSSREWDLYGVISCGYALEVLGSGPAHPVHVVEGCSADELEGWLDRLDWDWLAWPSGSWIDAVATAISFNRRHHGSRRSHPMLWGWLATHVSRHTGMWGSLLAPAGGLDVGWLMAVNGYYRLIRGTYAQFGVPVPHPEAAIDTVLAHARDYGWFAERDRNTCNVLDIVHPLWMLSRQTDHRTAEIRDGVAGALSAAMTDWVDGCGVPWEVGATDPGLQGTEMWLSIVYLAADLLGESDGLPWRPRGVHWLEAVDGIGSREPDGQLRMSAGMST
jgi:acetyltransferase-like isoleucine patch superfamily enzyme